MAKQTAKASSNVSTNSSKGKSKLPLIIGVIILIVIIAIVIVLFNPFKPAKTTALLVIEKGTVQIDSGSGFEKVESGIKLKSGDKIKTLSESEAKIVFIENTELRLSENTEITLTALTGNEEKGFDIKAKQENGSTWSQVIQLSGIQNYEVETPTTVATVRGTSFGLEVNEETGETDLAVNTGTVEAENIETSEKINVKKDYALNIKKGLKTLKAQKIADFIKTKPKMADWIEKHKEKDNASIEAKKKKIIEKLKMYVDILKSQYGVNDKQIDEGLTNYLKGEVKVRDLAKENKLDPEETDFTLRKFLNGELDPITVASKAEQLQTIFNKK